MKESFDSHPDFGRLASGLKNQAMQRGHDPTFAQDGPGMAMTCRDCGAQTHIEPHSGEWHAMASSAHRLHFTQCPTAQPAPSTIYERMDAARKMRM